MSLPMNAPVRVAAASLAAEPTLDDGNGTQLRAGGPEKNNRSPKTVPGAGMVRSAHGGPTYCVWPASSQHACRKPAQQGRTCPEHMAMIYDRTGTLDCAWPGCAWRAWDRKGLCFFHPKVSFGLVDS